KPRTAPPNSFGWRLNLFTTISPYLGDYYRFQRARHGAVKAIKNTAHKLARIFFHVVTTHQPYDETVFAKLEARNQKRRLHKLQSLAKQYGYSLVETHA